MHSIEKPHSTQSVSSNTQSASYTKRFKSAYSQATLHSFMNKKTREVIVSKLVAVDGFHPSAVCKSEYICQAFSDKGLLFPQNLNHVMQLVYKQYEIAKYVMVEMPQSLMSGKRFSLSLDEYTSLRHKGYLIIYVHRDKYKCWNLGIVAISKRMTVDEVENRLNLVYP